MCCAFASGYRVRGRVLSDIVKGIEPEARRGSRICLPAGAGTQHPPIWQNETWQTA